MFGNNYGKGIMNLYISKHYIGLGSLERLNMLVDKSMPIKCFSKSLWWKLLILITSRL